MYKFIGSFLYKNNEMIGTINDRCTIDKIEELLNMKFDCSKKCDFCENWMSELKRCKFCHFEYDEEYNPYARDDWDILNLKEEDGWEHLQILDRLHYKKIECLFADIWFNNNMAFLVGCKGSDGEISRALNISKDVIYTDHEHGLVILNLFQEKFIRGLL